MSVQTILASLLEHEPVALLAKVSAVLVGATLITLALGRASAAVRHLVWLSALAACLALPLVSPIAPRLTWPLSRVAPIEVVSTDPITRAVYVGNTNLAVAYTDGAANVPAELVSTNAVETPAATWQNWLASHTAELVVGVWLLGCCLVLGRCVLGHAAVRRLIRHSTPVASEEWDASLAAAADVADVDRPVRVLSSDALGAPVTSGCLDPVILVPADAGEWSAERRHVVLVHELAHVGRLDYLAQLIATLASALFWFHPLVWFAIARLRAEAEQAADDRVLESGTSAVAYASHLLDLARVESGLHLSAAVAVGMVKASRLEGRFRAMLDHTRSRAAVSRSLQTTAASFTLAAVIPFAGLRAGAEPMVVHVPVEVTTAAPAPVVVEVAAAVEQEPIAVAQRLVIDSLVELNIDGAGAERLSLDLETGGNVRIRGSDGTGIRVRARLGGQDWRDTDVRLTRSGSVVRLSSEFVGSRNSRSTSNAFEIWVPRRISVDLKSAGGSVTINDVQGEFRGHTGGGEIAIEGASGEARLSTGGGNVSVTNSSLGGAVSTGGGSVTIANAGTITGSSGSGPVITNGGFGTSITGTAGGSGAGRGFGGSAGAGTGVGRTYSTTTTIRSDYGMTFGPVAYSIKKAGGDIVVEDVPNGALLTTGGGYIRVGSSRGNLVVSTGGGRIDLPSVGGNVSASTGAGDVMITVVNTDGTVHSVAVVTGKGNVQLELPADLDATFELESAYTELHARTNIDTDFALERSETDQWDDSEGTARKFVRARGRAGNGRGLIHVRVVNGDITVRRK